MSMSRFLLGSGLESRVLLPAGGQAAIRQHARLREILAARAPAAADLFAEPVLDAREDGQRPTRASWYAPAGAEPVPLPSLRTAQRLLAESSLREQLSALHPLLADPEVAPLLCAALAVPGPGDILWTGESVVLVNWGMVPDSVGDAPAALARHFDATLGAWMPPGGNPWTAPPASAAETPGRLPDTPAGAAAGAATHAAPGRATSAQGTSAQGTPDSPAGVPPGMPPGPPAGFPPGLPPGPPPGSPPGSPSGAPLPAGRSGGVLGAVGAVLAAIVLVLLLSAVAVAAGYYYGWHRLVQELQAQVPPPGDPGLDADMRRMQEGVNEGLRQRIATLEGALRGNVCVAPAGPMPALPEQRADPAAPDRSPGQPPGQQAMPLLPPAPEAQPVERPAPQPGQAPAVTNLADLLDDSVVLVLGQVQRPDGQGISTGTGFAIGPRLVVTNRHVVAEVTPGRLRVASRRLGRLVAAEVVASTPGNEPGQPDFAVLRLAEGELPPLVLTPAVDRLLPVVAVGFPGFVVQPGDDFQRLLRGEAGNLPSPVFTSGEVSALQELRGQRVVIHTAAINRGNSGGPLADRCGRVVSVNTFLRADREVAYRADYALPTASLLEFLRRNNVEARTEEGPCRPAAASPAAPSAGPQGGAQGGAQGGLQGGAPGTPPPGTAPPGAAPQGAAPQDGRPASPPGSPQGGTPRPPAGPAPAPPVPNPSAPGSPPAPAAPSR
ncbi:serine protease [Roseomonas sp. NAR14]|uniref:Serine protease n=1 Tax=Roseomonas acroporae TaxID=2937791 RepID=A0A9X1YA64_9PROT|nr:serine protease [Roseomonas acroporae]MCK8785920.1 serine protease [Roseomonas acroporae]